MQPHNKTLLRRMVLCVGRGNITKPSPFLVLWQESAKW